MSPRHYFCLASLAALLLSLCPDRVVAQQPGDWDSRRVFATRSQVQALLARLDSVAESKTSTDARRAQARLDAASVRARLAEGDFQAGDRILLRVAGEQQLNDTVTVDEGRVLRLPPYGEMSLTGVLRGELEEHVREQLAAYIKSPAVRARPLVRIGVMGEVNRPGYYQITPTSLVEDVLMAAGGPTRDAKVTRIVVRRTDGQVWDRDLLQRAIADGRSLDQLGVRSGDQLFVPRRKPFMNTVQAMVTLVTIPITLYTLTRIFPP